jgi:hypothetical protein
MENDNNPRQIVRSSTTNSKKMAGVKKLCYSHEFTNYKPLSALDTSIENDDSEHIPTKRHIKSEIFPLPGHAIKLLVDIDYISPLLNQVNSLSLETKFNDITPDISIKFTHRNQLFLDLDDTLITRSSLQVNPDDIYFDSSSSYVSIRPFSKLLLSKVSAHYDVIVSESSDLFFCKGILHQRDAGMH